MIKVDDIVIIHDETPRSEWKLAICIVEKLVVSSDGITRMAEICTAGRKTNRRESFRSRILLMELVMVKVFLVGRPTRQATLSAQNRIKHWADVICVAPGNVVD